MIGLTESSEQYVARGYTPLRGALGQLRFRRYGMPFSPAPKPRVSATARACRAIVAARLRDPGQRVGVFRALQLANFTTPLVLEDDGQLRDGAGARARDRRLRRSSPDRLARGDRGLPARPRRGAHAPAARPPSFRERRRRRTDRSASPHRRSCSSAMASPLVAGGFQPIEAYDVLVANIDPTLEREPPPDGPEPLLDYFPEGLTTQEVALCSPRQRRGRPCRRRGRADRAGGRGRACASRSATTRYGGRRCTRIAQRWSRAAVAVSVG